MLYEIIAQDKDIRKTPSVSPAGPPRHIRRHLSPELSIFLGMPRDLTGTEGTTVFFSWALTS